MEKINIAIVEDEFIVARDMAGQLENIGYNIAGIFESGDELISYIKHNEVDILLIDINIKGALDGIETAEVITRIVDIPFIYVTAYSDSTTLSRAKHTKPHAFIVKPFNFETLHSAIELALFNFSNDEKSDLIHGNTPGNMPSNGLIGTKAFFLKTGGKYEKISPSEVFGFKANGSYTDIVLKDKRFTISQNLHKILTKMSNFPFVRIHRSHAVNIDYIQSIEEDRVTLQNGVWLKLSNSYKDGLLKKIQAI